MYFKTKIFFIIAASFLSLNLLAQQESVIVVQSSKQKPNYCYDSWVLLDPEIPIAKKLEDIRGLEVSAESGDRSSQHLIGSLYRLGGQHPAKIFPADVVKAKKFLGNAAIQGSFQAMAAMAELELANKNNKDAMLWSQVFAYYSKEETEKLKDGSNLAYQAFLLKRVIDAALKENKDYLDKSFMEDFNNFFVNHDAKIQANNKRVFTSAEIKKYKACDFANKDSTLQNTVLLNANKIRANAQTSYTLGSPGFAYFLLGINADGVVVRALVVDSLPTEMYAEGLTVVAKALKFNKTPEIELRQAYVPLTFDDNSIRIKKKRGNSTSHR